MPTRSEDVIGVERKWLAHGQNDAFDPTRTLLPDFVGTLASPPYSSPSCEAVSSLKDDETNLSVDEAK
jgi:hypothetical protein